MDGEITIGTTLSTDKFDRQITELEKKMQKEEDKKINIGAKLSTQEQELERAKKKVDDLTNSFEKMRQAQNAIEKRTATPTQFTEFFGYKDTFGSVENLASMLDNASIKQNTIEQKVNSTKLRYQEINDKVSEYKQKIENIQLQKQADDVDRIRKGFNNVGSSIEGSIKKVARLALGIFGIRSAYLALRRASSDLASYDKQYAANIEYIRYALTQMIAPVLRYIVSLVATILGYINAILNAWFGINLFGKASAKDFQNMKAGASGTSKAVKEIKKQLAGFDEINMLTDQSDTNAGGGGGGGVAPDFDLSGLQGDPPEWLKWIIDNKDIILSLLAGVLAFIIAIKLGLDGIKALGIGLAVAGIVYAIQKFLDYTKDPSFENFGGIIQGIGVAILGLGVAFLGLPGIIGGVVVLIFGTIVKYWNKIKSFFQSGIDWLKSKSDWVRNMFGDTVGNIYDSLVAAIQNILDWFDEMFKSIKGQFDGIIMFLEGVFTGDWNKAWEGIRKGFAAWWEGIKGMFNQFKQYLTNNIINPIKSLFSGLFSWITDIWNRIKKTFVQVGATIGTAVSNSFKAVVNAILGTIERILNVPIRQINNLIGIINNVPGINLGRLNTISLPRLKTGAILNMPNKGTLVGGSALAGESGREGIIPLTDQQAMSELGREIGKNILINLTNITSMNGRTLAKEIKQITTEQEFAFNN